MSETTYYQINRETILNGAKEHDKNDKERQIEREQKISIENYLKKK